MEISTQTDSIGKDRREANKRYYEKHKERVKQHNREYKKEQYVPTGNSVGRPKKPKPPPKPRGRPRKIKTNLMINDQVLKENLSTNSINNS